MSDAARPEKKNKISWRGGLYLVGPDPLTSVFYASGLLIAAGVGYASPIFIIGLYALLFVLAPIYIEAVLMTLSNGGTYNMIRTALQKMPLASMGGAAVVGIVTSVSYIATAIVSEMAFSHYLLSLTHWAEEGHQVYIGVILSALPSLGFGLWVMWKERMRVVRTIGITTLLALALCSVMPDIIVVMLNPVILLYILNNQGLRESVQVSQVIFLTHLVIMGTVIVLGVMYIITHGFPLDLLLNGSAAILPDGTKTMLPGMSGLTVALVIAGVGNAILGASGVESVMQIPEELDDPREAVPKIYNWMLSILLGFGGLVTLMIFFILNAEELATGKDYLVSMVGHKAMWYVTGSASAAEIFKTIIVIDAALTLIGATNTSFAGIRGLWVTMAKDHLLPRMFLKTDPKLDTHKNIHILFLVGIAVLAWASGANHTELEHWYSGTFGAVLLSGIIGIVLLRYFQPDAPRPYRAPWDIKVFNTEIPIAAFVGLVVVGGALVSLYLSARTHIESLQQLLYYLFMLVVIVIAYYVHPSWIRAWSRYKDQILLDHRKALNIEKQRAVSVCVGGYRAYERVYNMLEYAVMHQYRHLVVMHVTESTDRTMVINPHDDSSRYMRLPGVNARRILETLTTLPEVDDVELHFVLLPQEVHVKWQDTVTEFLQDTPEIHFVAVGPGEALDDSSYARVLVINTD
jgi:amino acid transporter